MCTLLQVCWTQDSQTASRSGPCPVPPVQRRLRRHLRGAQACCQRGFQWDLGFEGDKSASASDLAQLQGSARPAPRHTRSFSLPAAQREEAPMADPAGSRARSLEVLLRPQYAFAGSPPAHSIKCCLNGVVKDSQLPASWPGDVVSSPAHR